MVSRFGMAKGGAMDEYSAALANSLVGNKEGTPLLELTLKGPVLTALQDVVLGFAGYGMQPLVNKVPVESFLKFSTQKG